VSYSQLPHPRIGDQLWLWSREPWEGVSPRALTMKLKPLFLRQEPPRHEDYFDAEQLEFWTAVGATLRERRPGKISQGAPSLLPLRKPKASRCGYHKGDYHGETA